MFLKNYFLSENIKKNSYNDLDAHISSNRGYLKNLHIAQLIQSADIVLDSLDWSGLNTSLEAISLNKPIITLPSDLMRSRHTFGVLKIL